MSKELYSFSLIYEIIFSFLLLSELDGESTKSSFLISSSTLELEEP